MNYLSVCSGVEAASVAWKGLGWNPLGFSEIEKFPSEVLQHHYPNVPNLGDMTNYRSWNFGKRSVDLVVGGTPCQSFSVAGLRKGMEDPRGNLALTFCAILDKFRPKWFIWENVPDVLSSNTGRDFGSFLGAVAELRYGASYRVLDAQNFGVPQRRRRVFVVGHLGDWKPTSEVLFESESLRWHPKKSRHARKDSPGYIEGGFGAYNKSDVGGTTKASGGVLGGGSETFVLGGEHTAYSVREDAQRNNMSVTELDKSNCISAHQPSVMSHHAQTFVADKPHTFKIRGGCEGGGKGYLGQDEKTYTISRTQDQHLYQQPRVRRLTPIECERLQGFPDNYTNIKENCPDGHRYKAMGNSMAVPVMKWIGTRINNYKGDTDAI